MPKRSFDWREPSLMLGSWFIGLLLCVGHFFFYRSLDGTTTDDNVRSFAGYEYTAQQLNIAVGTTFAFLVKSAFVLAASTAYFLMFWKIMRGNSKGPRPPTISHLDATFAALNNFTTLFRLPVWMRYPFLSLMALTIWFLPIPSLITPATLSVVFGPAQPRVLFAEIPSIYFSTLSYVAGLTWGDSPLSDPTSFSSWSYNGPSGIIKKLTLAVTTQGAIQPIRAPFVNSTWQLQLEGPSLQCDDFSAADVAALKQEISNQFKVFEYGVSEFMSKVLYLSWLSASGKVETPFKGAIGSNSPHFLYGSSLFSNKSTSPILETVLALGVFPDGVNVTRVAHESLVDVDFGKATLVRCRFLKSKYLVHFEYNNGNQTITSRIVNDEPAVPARVLKVVNSIVPVGDSFGSNHECLQLSANLSIVPFNTTERRTNSRLSQGKSCVWNPEVADTLAYQALFQAYSNLLVGKVTLDPWHPSPVVQTSALTTTLIRSKELQFLSDLDLDLLDKNPIPPSLQSALVHYGSKEEDNAIAKSMSGIPALQQAQIAVNISLKDAVQDMFTNLTISLMSNPLFRYGGPGTGTTPVRAQVTEYPYQNFYVFGSTAFVAAYASAAFISLLAIVAGLIVISMTRVTLNHNFSTLMRVGRGADLSVEIHDEDLDGHSPLPHYLSNATVRVRIPEILGSTDKELLESGTAPTQSPTKVDLVKTGAITRQRSNTF